MADTPNLGLPEIAAAQAQKHVTHNEALWILDALAQLAVLNRDLAAPPGAPGDGARYIVAAGGTGSWDGHDGEIAHCVDGAWRFYQPVPGWLAFVVDESKLLYWTGSAWADFLTTVTALQNLALLGLGTTADATNPFSAKVNKALWTARTVGEGGDGSLLYTLNKEGASDDAGFILQSNFVTKALLGLFGSDDLRLSVSDDGSAFKDAMSIDRNTGAVDFPNLTRFIAHINFDQYIGADSWTKVPINDTTGGYNDQNAFDGGSNRFTAPAAGVYQFGATLGWKRNNTNVPTVAKARFVKNGGGSPTVVMPPLVSRPLSGVAIDGTELVLCPSVLVNLAEGDTMEVQQLFTSLDGYIPATVTTFWGHKVG